MYSLSPSTNPILNHRIELLPSTVKFKCGTEKDVTGAGEYARTEPLSNANQILTGSVANRRTEYLIHLNIDKNFYDAHLKYNPEMKRRYFETMAVQSHLTWAYYHYAHQIQLKFDKFSIYDFTDFYQPIKKLQPTRSNLFNIDPIQFIATSTPSLAKTSLINLFNDFLKSKTEQPSNLRLFIVPKYLVTTESNYDGLATQSSACHTSNKRPTVLVLTDKYSPDDNLIQINRVLRSIRPAIEQANILIDLIGHSFNSVHSEPECSDYDEFNWHFQTNPEETSESRCINRRVVLSNECASFCGDGLIGPGEDCDCAEDDDSNCAQCCDVKTCKFRTIDAECASGACCDNNCKLKSKSSICRLSLSSCDFEEFCDGISPICPEDLYHHNGLDCLEQNEPGLCWMGKCQSSNSQCKSIWSTESISSDKVCYNKFNTVGFENGHCGADRKKKTYEPCGVRDAQCGLLNCQLGTDEPLLKTEGYFKSTTGVKGRVYECKVLTGESAVYVNDGVRCEISDSSTGICVSRRCVPIEAILSPGVNKCLDMNQSSSQFCSGNGICDNFQKCQCEKDWSGDFCENFIGVRSLVEHRGTTPKPTPMLISPRFSSASVKTPLNQTDLSYVTILSVCAGVFFILFSVALFAILLCR